jgi:hypothetical protein
MSSPKPRAVLQPARRVLVKRISITRLRRRFIIPALEKVWRSNLRHKIK